MIGEFSLLIMKKLLNERYEKLVKLDQGGYGIIYKAIDNSPDLQDKFNFPFVLPLNTTKASSNPKISKMIQSILGAIKAISPNKSPTTIVHKDSFVALKKCRFFDVFLIIYLRGTMIDCFNIYEK